MIKETAQDIAVKWLNNILKYQNDFFGYCVDVLGYKDLNKEHVQLCSFLEHCKKFNLVLTPRGTFKSTICTIARVLWRLMQNPNLRILIYSDTTAKAQGFLNEIKGHLEGKTGRMVELYGQWATDARKGKWNESQIVISKRGKTHKEPTIDTGGIETSKTGFHYDIIIFDDIVTDQNVTTKDQMDKVRECYRKSLSLLMPGGEVWMVGTRWDFGDLYGRLIAENEESKIFDIFHRKSGYYGGNLIYADIGLTREFLELQLNQQGSYLFSCLYENEPVDQDTQTFKAQDFRFYGDICPDDLYITGTCDPAGMGEDKTAIVVVGTDHELNMYILDVVLEHYQPNEIVQKIIELNYKWQFRTFGIETNFFRGTLELELKRRVSEEHDDNYSKFPLFHIEPMTAGSGDNKKNRMRALQPYHERGSILFPGKKLELLEGSFAELANQMMRFPRAQHDDAHDALAYHIPLIRKGGIVKKKEVPENTPAWIEQQIIQRVRDRNKTLPRRYRQSVPESIFS